MRGRLGQLLENKLNWNFDVVTVESFPRCRFIQLINEAIILRRKLFQSLELFFATFFLFCSQKIHQQSFSVNFSKSAATNELRKIVCFSSVTSRVKTRRMCGKLAECRKVHFRFKRISMNFPKNESHVGVFAFPKQANHLHIVIPYTGTRETSFLSKMHTVFPQINAGLEQKPNKSISQSLNGIQSYIL